MMYRTQPPPLPRWPVITFTVTDRTLRVSWSEVERVLGREYAITAEDDAIITAAIHASGPPDWVLAGECEADLDVLEGLRLHRVVVRRRR